jgi:hypothetical protein
MPNWNENKLSIMDCSPELESYLKENGLSFEKIKPTPPEMLGVGNNSWYGWRVSNWGTKWDLTEQEQREVADQLISESADFQATFMTAWSPPLEAIAALSEMFPHDQFTLDYFESGCWFAGTAVISQGEIDDNQVDDDDVAEFAKENFNFVEYDEDEEIPADV